MIINRASAALGDVVKQQVADVRQGALG